MDSIDDNAGRGAVEEPTGGAHSPGDAPVRTAPRRAGGRLRLLGDILLIAGGLVLSYPFWSAAYAQVQQGRLDAAYRDSSASFAVVMKQNDARLREVPKEQVLRHLASLFGRRLSAGEPIGRLLIPRLELNRLVQEGVSRRGDLDPSADRRLLRNGPVHYAVTPLPGAGEPFAVAGHRTTYGAPFFKLDRLRKGDRILLDTPYARFRYAVAKTRVVRPGDVGVLSDRGYALVLTTCTPAYSASRRLIVFASLSSATPHAGAYSGRP